MLPTCFPHSPPHSPTNEKHETPILTGNLLFVMYTKHCCTGPTGCNQWLRPVQRSKCMPNMSHLIFFCNSTIEMKTKWLPPLDFAWIRLSLNSKVEWFEQTPAAFFRWSTEQYQNHINYVQKWAFVLSFVWNSDLSRVWDGGKAVCILAPL